MRYFGLDMLKQAAAAVLILALAACQKSGTKVLIGATTITHEGASPLRGSIIVIEGRSIRAVGLQKDVPVPQDSQRLDLSGKWVVPADAGQIAAGEPANLKLLDHAPPAAAVNTMLNGEWQSAR